jgi:hypothetical protein
MNSYFVYKCVCMPKNYPDYLVLTLEEFKESIEEEDIFRIVNNVIIDHSPSIGHDLFHPKAHMHLLLQLDMEHRKLGFDMLHYNLVIFPDGMIGYCRPVNMIPGGLRRNMSHDVSICVLGNFSDGGDQLTSEQECVVLEILSYLCKKLDISPDTEHITFLNWYNQLTGEMDDTSGKIDSLHKSGPGVNFFGGLSAKSSETFLIPLLKVKYKLNKIPTSDRLNGRKVKQAIVTSDSLRVRDLPQAEGLTLAKLRRGTIVPVYESMDGWMRISKKTSRWVSDRFVEIV